MERVTLNSSGWPSTAFDNAADTDYNFSTVVTDGCAKNFIIFISNGNPFGLKEKEFETESFNQRSWEAEIWFDEKEPDYLRHNLYEEEVAKTTRPLVPWRARTMPPTTSMSMKPRWRS